MCLEQAQARESLLLDKQKETQKVHQSQLNQLQEKLDTQLEDYASLSTKHANLLVSKKEMEEEMKVKISSTEVSQEISSMRFELKRLHEILAEKEKELISVKLQEGLNYTEQIDKMRSEVINKEAKIHEVQLQLELEQRKMTAYQEHISYLKNQLVDLQNQADVEAKSKSEMLKKFQGTLRDDVNSKLVKELKEQLKIEQDKLRKVSSLIHFPVFRKLI